MDLLIVGLLILLCLVVLFMSRREMMTNKDLLDTLDKFGKDGTKKVSSSEIYGPKTTKAEPEPEHSSSKDEDNLRSYPDIYGPETTPIPGKKPDDKKDKKEKDKENLGEQSPDNTQDEGHQFNPSFASAFPHDENGPQPFLADFSKIQR